MRKIVPVVILICIILVCACQKYEDKKTSGDPRLTNPYCNDPNAVNYNWGFPGRPDDSVCFYPNDLFVGKYVFYDSVLQSDLTPTYSVIDTIYISSTSHTQLTVVGLCPVGDTLHLTAGVSYVATVDTIAAIGKGQTFCRTQDTVNGTMTKNLSDTLPIIHINLMVMADTGTTYHTGIAQKL